MIRTREVMILPILLLLCKNPGKMSDVLVYVEIVLNMCRVLVYAKNKFARELVPLI